METYTGLDDPRMFPTREELPTTFAGAKEMPMWNAQIIDLNELPIEEYMKPMPVNVVSGGTGPGPEPTPSGSTSYLVTFYIDGQDVQHYDVVEGQKASLVPSTTKEGYTFSGWTPSNPAVTVITAVTNFYGWFIENEPTNAYYTLTMVPKESEIDESGLTECGIDEFADGKAIRFKVPLSEYYAEMSEKHENRQITEDEWEEFLDEWRATQLYVVQLITPKDITKDNITVVNAAQTPVSVTGPTIVTIDGQEYNCFKVENEYFTPTEEDQFFKLTITIK